MAIQLFGCGSVVDCGECPPDAEILAFMTNPDCDQDGPITVPGLWIRDGARGIPPTIPVTIEISPGVFDVVDEDVLNVTVSVATSDGATATETLGRVSDTVEPGDSVQCVPPLGDQDGWYLAIAANSVPEIKVACVEPRPMCAPSPWRILDVIAHTANGSRTYSRRRDPWTGALRPGVSSTLAVLTSCPTSTGCDVCGYYVPGIGLVLWHPATGAWDPATYWERATANPRTTGGALITTQSISEKTGFVCSDCKQTSGDERIPVTIPAGTYYVIPPGSLGPAPPATTTPPYSAPILVDRTDGGTPSPLTFRAYGPMLLAPPVYDPESSSVCVPGCKTNPWQALVGCGNPRPTCGDWDAELARFDLKFGEWSGAPHVETGTWVFSAINSSISIGYRLTLSHYSAGNTYPKVVCEVLSITSNCKPPGVPGQPGCSGSYWFGNELSTIILKTRCDGSVGRGRVKISISLNAAFNVDMSYEPDWMCLIQDICFGATWESIP